jgi:tRNA(fMet)-specific endonuclease VapC
MGMIYLTDTNIVSEMMRPQPNPGVRTFWQRHHASIAIASVTWHELLAGTYRLPLSQRRSGMESFLRQHVESPFPILPYDQRAAEWHALERARLSQMGRTPSYPDGQIAAIAATNRLILVTRNMADFADFKGLEVEDWFS